MLLETDGQYPKKIFLLDKIDEFSIRETETITAAINLESREYNGRWYTDVKAWKVSRDGIEADFSAFPVHRMIIALIEWTVTSPLMTKSHSN